MIIKNLKLKDYNTATILLQYKIMVCGCKRNQISICDHHDPESFSFAHEILLSGSPNFYETEYKTTERNILVSLSKVAEIVDLFHFITSQYHYKFNRLNAF